MLTAKTNQLHEARKELWKLERDIARADRRAQRLRLKILLLSGEIATPPGWEELVGQKWLPETQRDQ